MIKRVTLLALLGVSASSIALADTYNPPAPAQPCNLMCTDSIQGGFYVGVTGIYAKPGEDNIGLVTDSWQYQQPNGQIVSQNKPFEPSNRGGIGAKVGYDFASSANSLEFDYLHFNNSTNAVNTSAGAPDSFASVFFPNVVVKNPDTINLISDAKLAYNLNQYDLWLGHTFGSSSNFTFKPEIGARYAGLSHNMTFAAPGYIKSNFEGVGPEMGFDAHYELGYGFGVIGHLDDAVLASRVDGSSAVNFGPINAMFNSPDANRVSNAITARLGADYKYVFTNGSSLALEGGYQAMQYSDAFDIIQGDVTQPPASGEPLNQHIVDVNSDNFSLRGPYLTLTYHV